ALIAVGGDPPTAATQQTASFRAGVDLVEIDAVVTDQRGTIVRGLGRDDFEILEDNKAQQLASIDFIDIPLVHNPAGVSALGARTESDVSSNQDAAASRAYVIALDSFHVAPGHTPLVRQLAKRFIDQAVGDKDVVAVVNLGNSATSQGFTSSRQLLYA